MTKPIRIEFAPGAFDHFEGTQEELDQLISEIHSMFEGKTFEELELTSNELSDEAFDELPEEIQLQILRSTIPDEVIEDFQRKLQ
jgi:hypothetical protein